MKRADELEGIRFLEKMKRRQQNEQPVPTVATWRAAKADDEITREAANLILNPASPVTVETFGARFMPKSQSENGKLGPAGQF
jgi:hypothetical protein